MKVWEIDRVDDPGNPLVVNELGLIRDALLELRDASRGDAFTVQVKEMTEEQYNALPEWEGW